MLRILDLLKPDEESILFSKSSLVYSYKTAAR